MKWFWRVFPFGLIALSLIWFLRDCFVRPTWGDEIFSVYPPFFRKSYSFFLPWKFVDRAMGHPPLHALFVRLGFDLTGSVMMPAILLSFFSALVCLWLIYGLAERRAGPRAGWIAMFLLGSLPVFMANCISTLCEFPSIAAGLGALVLAQKRRWGWSCFLLCVSVYLRESGLAFVAGFSVFFLAKSPEGRPRPWVLLIPLLVLGSHFAFSKYLEESWSLHPYALGRLKHTHVDFFTFQGKGPATFRAYENFRESMGGLGFLLPLLTLPFFIKKEHEKRELVLSAFTVSALLFLAFFLLYADHVDRDFIPFFMLLCLSAGLCVDFLLRPLRSRAVNAAILVLGFALFFSRADTFGRKDNLISGVDPTRIRFVQAEVESLENCCRNKKIYADHPFSDILDEPLFGYVKTPFQLVRDINESEVVISAWLFPVQAPPDSRELWTDKSDSKWVTVFSRSSKTPEGNPAGKN